MTAVVLLVGILMGTGGTSSACVPEQLTHASKKYAPLPGIRDLTEECGHIGTPTIQATVGVDGSLGEVRLLKSSGCKTGDERLKACLRFWRYEPATCAEEPIAEDVTITVHWHLEETEKEPQCKPEVSCGDHSG